MPCRGGLVLASVLAFAAATAHATPPPHVAFRLTYTHPPACGDTADLDFEFARRLGYSPFSPTAPTRLDVAIVRNGRALVATVTRYDDHGIVIQTDTYDGRADRCPSLVSSVGSIVSAQIDPWTMPALPPPPATIEAPTKPAPITPVVAAPPSGFTPPRRSGPSGELDIGPRIALGDAPGVAFGARVGAALRWTPVSLGAELRFAAPAWANVATLPRVSVSTVSVGGALVDCWLPDPFSLCAVASMAWVRASSAELNLPRYVPRSDEGVYVGAGARVGLEAPLTTRLAFRIHADALVTARAVSATVDGAQVWRTAPVSGELGFGLVFRFERRPISMPVSTAHLK